MVTIVQHKKCKDCSFCNKEGESGWGRCLFAGGRIWISSVACEHYSDFGVF